MKILDTIQIVLIILKLFSLISISWFIVLIPLWLIILNTIVMYIYKEYKRDIKDIETIKLWLKENDIEVKELIAKLKYQINKADSELKK